MAAPKLDSIVSEEVECAICLDRLQKPRILSCLHSFCEKCLKESIAKLSQSGAKRNSFQCPVCRADTKLSSEGVDGLRFDFRASKLVEALSENEKREEKITDSSQKCEACGFANSDRSGDSQFIFCCDCRQILSERCSIAHAGLRVLQNHTLVKISDLISGKVTIQTKEQSAMCPKHTDEKLKLFCVTCCEVICHDCTLFDHSRDNGHNFQFLKDYILIIQNELTTRLEKVNKKTDDFSEFLDSLDQAERQIKEQDGHLTKNNETVVKKHIQHIEDMRDRVLEEQNKIIEAKTKEVQDLRQEAQQMKLLSEKSSSMTKKVLGNAKDYIGIASMYNSLREAMDIAIAKKPKTEKLHSITKYVDNVHYHGLAPGIKTGRIITNCKCIQKRELNCPCEDGPTDVGFTSEGRIYVVVKDSCLSLTEVETIYKVNGAEIVYIRGPYNGYDYPYVERCINEYVSENVRRTDVYSCIKETTTRHQVCSSLAWTQWLPTIQYDTIVAFAPVSDHRFVLSTSDGRLHLLGDTLTNFGEGLPAKRSISAVATDGEDNIYVADKDNRCIYVLRDDGQLSRSVPTNNISPTAVAVSMLNP